MNVLYILDRPELGGGVKVVFQHAQLLQQRGINVWVIGRGSKPRWVTFSGTYVDISSPHVPLAPADIVIATYWTTFLIAENLNLDITAHFCQGYEASFPHLAPVKDKIEAAYNKYQVPTLVVSPSLGKFLKKTYQREWYLTPPPIDPLFRPAWLRHKPQSPPWIVIYGIFEAASKNVSVALQTVVGLRERGLDCRVLRVSTFPISDQEKTLLEADRYLISVYPQQIARVLRRCDLLLFPVFETEGFGLPLLEAMQSKVPSIGSRTAAIQYITDDTIPLVDPYDVAGFSDTAFHLLTAPKDWRKVRSAGFHAAQKFQAERVARHLSDALNEVTN